MPSNGLGVAALIAGILSLVWIPAGRVALGVLCGIAAVFLGSYGRGGVARGEATNGGVALAGIITGAIGLAVSAVLLAFVVVLAGVGLGPFG